MSWTLKDLDSGSGSKRAFPKLPKLPLKLIAAVLIVALVSVGVGYGIYTITSNSVAGVPLANAGAIVLSVNSTAPVQGDTLLLTATITSGLGVQGWSCQLYNNDVATGVPVVSGPTGVVTFQQIVTAAYSFKVVATKA
jgi:hypothetical protein